MKLFECVPNFSEGRNQEVIQGILKCFLDKENLQVLDYSSDVDHNRSVITMVAQAEALKDALLQAVIFAKEHIDMRNHKGAHPRMGAFDVIPIIPLEGATMEDAVTLSVEIGKTLYEKAGVPIFLYSESASAPHRAPLENLRRGEFEGMGDKVKNKEYKPDFGSEVHPTYGITAVGAREFLIAYNIVLNTSSVEIAKDIAKRVRQSSGGLPCVKALGLFLDDLQLAQVSMNLTDYKVTSMAKVFEKVKSISEEYGVTVNKSELIGLLPMEALIESFKELTKLEGFSGKRVLEIAMRDDNVCR